MATETKGKTELNAAEARLVAAVLASTTFRDAARAARIPIRSAYKIRSRPHVQAAIRKAAKEALEDATARLHGLAGKAIVALEAVLDDEEAPPAVTVRAALGVLEATRRFREDELEERLTALEAAMEQRKGNGHFH